MARPEYKFNEDVLLKEIGEYIDGTYQQHYASNNRIQVTEFIASHCDSPDFFRGNAMKYLARYGHKEGFNRKDLLKSVHYLIMLIAWHDEKVLNIEEPEGGWAKHTRELKCDAKDIKPEHDGTLNWRNEVVEEWLDTGDARLFFIDDPYDPIPKEVFDPIKKWNWKFNKFYGDHPRPVAFSTEEGDEWTTWRPGHKPTNKVHAIKFEDGNVFDAYNGWRIKHGDKKMDEVKVTDIKVSNVYVQLEGGLIGQLMADHTISIVGKGEVDKDGHIVPGTFEYSSRQWEKA